ncbi:MAG: dTDP-4-dehydrorhamnose reductase [Rhodoferax sp.]
MTVLLLGAQGQLGWELRRSLAVLGPVVAVARGAMGLEGGWQGDLTDVDGLRMALRALRPRIIVNAAAYTAVDKAETERDAAWCVNAQVPAVLAEEATALGAWLLHYSTDYVFDGSGSRPWCEDDATGPLSVYGASKLAGEEAVRQHAQHLVLRTSWVYAARGQNFAKTMLRLALQRDELRVVDDQWGAPTGADLLADVSAHVLRAVLRPSEGVALAGTYHLAASGETTWHAYAQCVVDSLRASHRAAQCRTQAITAVGSDAFPVAARRPLNSRLDTRKLRETFGLHLPDWRVGVLRMLEEIDHDPNR